ncbi:MAG TPA: ATP-binding protein [Candidatus Binatia bacterium]|nr:ATP-binding protein [Candidatus Binatia bacterium]
MSSNAAAVLQARELQKEHTKEKLAVLMVEDSPAYAELVLRELRKEPLDLSVALVDAPQQFERRLNESVPDVILADYNLGEWRGVETLDVLRRLGLDVPVIIVTGALGDVTAVECIKQGATDYVLKEGLARLPEAIRRALREKEERRLRRQVEEDLARKVDELARSNADLEQFAYVASHDLQEPLRMVAAYTQLLGERYRGKLDANADKFIGYASEGAQRMQVLIQDLLAFSRVGRKEMVGAEVDCNGVIKDVMVVLSTAIAESGVTISCDDLPTIWSDRTQISQVFQNLIGNAIKFRGKEKPRISVAAGKDGEVWRFSVSDNGIGIPREHTENIFAVFHRLHTRSEYPGNGIGLSICKKIIERQGGRIWVEAVPGGGSNFQFTIPVHGEVAA